MERRLQRERRRVTGYIDNRHARRESGDASDTPVPDLGDARDLPRRELHRILGKWHGLTLGERQERVVCHHRRCAAPPDAHRTARPGIQAFDAVIDEIVFRPAVRTHNRVL